MMLKKWVSLLVASSATITCGGYLYMFKSLLSSLFFFSSNFISVHNKANNIEHIDCNEKRINGWNVCYMRNKEKTKKECTCCNAAYISFSCTRI